MEESGAALRCGSLRVWGTRVPLVPARFSHLGTHLMGPDRRDSGMATLLGLYFRIEGRGI